MKQLSAMGARRQFFRNPRRLRALRPGEDFPVDGVDLLASGALGYFTGTCFEEALNAIALHRKPVAQLRIVTCHMGSHSVTCHSSCTGELAPS